MQTSIAQGKTLTRSQRRNNARKIGRIATKSLNQNQAPRRSNPQAPGKRWSVDIGPVDVLGMGKFGGAKISSRGARSDMVGLAERSENVQMVRPTIRSHRSKAIDIVTGTEYLGQISTGAEGASTGEILSTILINPRIFEETRLKQISSMYQRYRFTKAHIIYQADANATQSGSVIGFMDYDVDSLLTGDDPANVSKAAAQFAQQPNKIWQTQRYALGQVDSYTDLFINTTAGKEDRLVYQGVWYLIAATELPPDSALGTIYIDYEVELSIPSLENIDQVFYQSLALRANATGTVQSPFGATVSPDVQNQDFPVSNIEYLYSGGVTSDFTMYGLRRGMYMLRSEWIGQITAGSGAHTFSTTWQFFGVPPGIEWLGGGTSSTMTGLAQSAALSQTASLIRNSFSHTFWLPEYQAEVGVACVCSALGTGGSYGSSLASMQVFRIPSPVGFPPSLLQSRLLGRHKLNGMAFLNAKRHRVLVAKEADKPSKEKGLTDIEDCHEALRSVSSSECSDSVAGARGPSGSCHSCCPSGHDTKP